MDENIDLHGGTIYHLAKMVKLKYDNFLCTSISNNTWVVSHNNELIDISATEIKNLIFQELLQDLIDFRNESLGMSETDESNRDFHVNQVKMLDVLIGCLKNDSIIDGVFKEFSVISYCPNIYNCLNLPSTEYNISHKLLIIKEKIGTRFKCSSIVKNKWVDCHGNIFIDINGSKIISMIIEACYLMITHILVQKSNYESASRYFQLIRYVENYFHIQNKKSASTFIFDLLF